MGLLCKKCRLGEMLCEIKNYPFLCTCCTIFLGTLKLIIEQISFEKIVLKNRLSGKFIFLSLPLAKKNKRQFIDGGDPISFYFDSLSVLIAH